MPLPRIATMLASPMYRLLLLLLCFSIIGCIRQKNTTDNNGSKQVSHLNELLQQLEYNSHFKLQPGMYNITDLDTLSEGQYYRWSYYIEGEDYGWYKTMLTFRNLNNITIEGMGNVPSDTKIYSEDTKAIVLVFENCNNVTINNVWLGHITPSTSCFGGVISAVNSSNITINNTQMYGTGFYGFEVYDAKKLSCTNSEIWDCSGGAFHMAGCDTVIIENSKFYANTSRSHFSYLSNSPYININNCSWTNNKIENSAVEHQALFRLWNAHLTISNSTINNNHLESLVQRKSTDTFVLENVDTTNNVFEKTLEFIDP